MEIIKNETKIIEKIIGLQCDVCKIEFYELFKIQEFIRIKNIGGYGSIIGDSSVWEIDICEECFYKTFKDNIRIKNESNQIVH